MSRPRQEKTDAPPSTAVRDAESEVKASVKKYMNSLCEKWYSEHAEIVRNRIDVEVRAAVDRTIATVTSMVRTFNNAALCDLANEIESLNREALCEGKK